MPVVRGNFLPLLLSIVVMALTTAPAFRVRPQSIPPENKRPPQTAHDAELNRKFPVAEYDEAVTTDPEKQARRAARNQRYERRRLVKSKPDKSVLKTTRVTNWEVGMAAFPSARSHAVIIGEVLDAQAHLSNDKSGVYSEFNVRVGRVFKSLSGSLSPGDLMTVEREGGYVRYSHDYKRLYRIQGRGMPLAGRRYLLFLDPGDSTTGHQVITGYELSAGKVTPLDTPDQFAAYKDWDESKFLDLVRESLTRPEGPEALR